MGEGKEIRRRKNGEKEWGERDIIINMTDKYPAWDGGGLVGE